MHSDSKLSSVQQEYEMHASSFDNLNNLIFIMTFSLQLGGWNATALIIYMSAQRRGVVFLGLRYP
jgi:hypothetical protein